MDLLNISQVLTAYEASLTNAFKHKALTITGTLEPKNDTIYGGKLYWHLVDSGARLTVQMPECYRDFSGRRVEVTGRPTPRLWKDRGEIQVILNVENMNPLEPPPEDWIGPLRRIGEKRQSSWPAIECSIQNQILAGDHPCVLMFCGTSSMVGKDVRAALGQHARVHQIVEQRIPLTDAAAVATALSVQ